MIFQSPGPNRPLKTIPRQRAPSLASRAWQLLCAGGPGCWPLFPKPALCHLFCKERDLSSSTFTAQAAAQSSAPSFLSEGSGEDRHCFSFFSTRQINYGRGPVDPTGVYAKSSKCSSREAQRRLSQLDHTTCKGRVLFRDASTPAPAPSLPQRSRPAD